MVSKPIEPVKEEEPENLEQFLKCINNIKTNIGFELIKLSIFERVLESMTGKSLL